MGVQSWGMLTVTRLNLQPGRLSWWKSAMLGFIISHFRYVLVNL
jgi:hypothetical protein